MYILDVIPAVAIPNLETSVWSYFSPHELPEGALVEVPLGRRRIPAVVLRAHNARAQKMHAKKSAFQMKNATKILSREPALNPVQFALLAWCARYYFSTPSLFLKLMLPRHLLRAQRPLILNRQPHTKEIRAVVGPAPILCVGYARAAAYKKAIDECIAQGRQALILAPEIAKVNALAREFSSYHPAILTGELSPKKFFTAWDSVRMGTAQVLIGTRTAVYANFADIGLIIIDEEQSPHLKSWDMAPHYHAGDVAGKLAELSGAALILGSAAPSIASYYMAKKGTYAYAPVQEKKDAPPHVVTVDMRNELRNKNYSSISYQLNNALEEIINHYEKKAILCVSRRGTASFSFCQDCGFLEKCPHCDMHLVRHTAPKNDTLLCHLCGFIKEPDIACPSCRGTRMKNFGAGTHQVKNEIEKLYEYHHALILDSDAAKTPRAQKAVCDAFARGDSRILIGTQALLNRPEIPAVDLLGIISLDNMLYIPEYTSGERIYRLIGGLMAYCRPDTSFIFQTHTPEYEPLQPIIARNYAQFFAQEIRARKEFGYPPFSRIVKLSFMDASRARAEHKAKAAAEKLTRAIAHARADIECIGPAPAYIPKVKNNYLYHCILKIKNTPLALRNDILRLAADEAVIDVDPENLL